MARRARTTVSPLEHRFIDHLLECAVASEAARRADYKGDYPAQWASKTLAREPVREELKRRQAELRNLTKISLAQQIKRFERRRDRAEEAGQHGNGNRDLHAQLSHLGASATCAKLETLPRTEAPRLCA